MNARSRLVCAAALACAATVAAVSACDGGKTELPVQRAPEREYPLIYRRFAELLRARESEVDASPLRIIADAFLVGSRETTEPFFD